MRKTSKIPSIIVVVLVGVLVLSACGFDVGGGGQAHPAGGNNKTLIIAESAEPPNLDPSKSTDVVSARILNNVMEGLTRLDKNDQPQPAIAASKPEVSADKLTYTFTLRDAKWSDGKPVRAQDFKYAWLRALNAKTKSEYAFILFPIKNAEQFNAGKVSADKVGVKVLDDKHLQVKLKAPTPYFIDLCAFTTYFPQREDFITQNGSQYAKEADRLIFNGPFRLTSWKHEASFTMKKNPNYWDAKKVKLETIDGKIIKEVSSAVNLYNSNKIDFTEISQEFADAFNNKPDRTVIKELSSWYLEMNQTKPFFKNRKIREAINYAIDKKTLTDSVMKTGSRPAGAMIPPSIKATAKQSFRELVPDQVKYDVVKAKSLYAQGLKELRLSKQPDNLELVGDDTDGSKKQMEYIKEQLRKNMGLEIKVAAVPFKQRLERGKSQQFDLLASGWNGDYNDPMTFADLFLTGSPYNRGKWSNAQYDALVMKSMANANEQERLNDLIKAEKLLVRDTAVVPLYYRSRLGITKPFVKKFEWHAVGSYYSLKNTYID